MIVVPLTDFQFSFEPFFNKLFKLSLLKYMIVSMIHSRSFILISYRSLNKAATLAVRSLLRLLLKWRFLGFLLLIRLLILVLEVPSDKDVLGLENFVFLFVGPHIDKDPTAYFQNTVEFANCSQSQGSG